MNSQDCRLIPIQSDFNEYIHNMETIYGMKQLTVIICCVVQKTKDSIANTYPIQGLYETVYQNHMQEAWQEVAVNFLKVNQDKQIALYGKGGYCDTLLNELFKNDMKNHIKCIFDSNPQIARSSYRGYKVFYPTKEKVNAMDIIIANHRFENEIYSVISEYGTHIADKTYKISRIVSEVTGRDL